VAGAAGWGLWIFKPEKAPAPIAVAPPPVETAPQPETPPTPPLPSLTETDSVVRKLMAQLGEGGILSGWLKESDLVRRFVAGVARIADGESPRLSFSFLSPAGQLQVVTEGGRTFIDPKSYQRYDAVSAAVGSLEPTTIAKIYQSLRPLLEAAYREIGPPNTSFEQVLSRAMGRLIAVPVPAGQVEVVPHTIGYRFKDPKLEALPAGEKHLLRMGPENMKRIQAKLRDLSATLGVSPNVP
jgi:hypothetical protein